MTVKERLIQFINYKGISIRSFCRLIGVSNAYVTSMRNSMQPDKVHKILMIFPELNSGWLMTGEGEMIRNEFNPVLPSIERDALVNHASEAFKDKLIEMFKNGEIFSAAVVREKDFYISKLIKRIERLENELATYQGIKRPDLTDNDSIISE